MLSDVTRFGNPARYCPVCGGRDSKLLYKQAFQQLAGAKLLDGYDIVVCDACGAGYAEGIPEQVVFDQYYRDLSKYEDGDQAGREAPAREPRFLEMANLLGQFIPHKNSRILEIGCGSGQLLGILREQQFLNVLGADPSPGCSRAAKRFYDVPVMASTVFTVPQPSEPYEFLILIGVMEHIRDLDRTVEQFHSLLAPGGRIYIEVPDASRLAPSMDAPFQEFSVEHINYFSPMSLTNLMLTRGFRAVATGRAERSLHEVSCLTAYGVYERAETPEPVVKDVETEPGLRAYIAGCQDQDQLIRSKIQNALQPGEQMIVWGVGAHTLRLLATGGLDPSRIALFVDSNPKYQDDELDGIRVVSPRELKWHEEPILISSRGFQHEIERQIRETLGLNNKLILLY